MKKEAEGIFQLADNHRFSFSCPFSVLSALQGRKKGSRRSFNNLDPKRFSVFHQSQREDAILLALTSAKLPFGKGKETATRNAFEWKANC
jgi:hypothetical protein